MLGMSQRPPQISDFRIGRISEDSWPTLNTVGWKTRRQTEAHIPYVSIRVIAQAGKLLNRSYLDEHIFIITWKAKFELRLLGLLQIPRSNVVGGGSSSPSVFLPSLTLSLATRSHTPTRTPSSLHMPSGLGMAPQAVQATRARIPCWPWKQARGHLVREFQGPQYPGHGSG